MSASAERQWLQATREILAISHLWQADHIPAAVNKAIDRLGIRASIYLIDEEQHALHALTPLAPDQPAAYPIGDSDAGEVFRMVRSTRHLEHGTARWWVPIVNGTDRLGVVEFALPAGSDAESQRDFEMLAGMIGHLLTTTDVRGDHLKQMRRTRPMSIASELLWQLLQPLTVAAERLAVAAILQPCYDVGGDAYDYSVDGDSAYLTVLDGVGKGLDAGLATAVALASLRAARRRGLGLADQASAADDALLHEFHDSRFVTAVLCRLNLDSGELQLVNAGHPPPLLLRSGKVVQDLGGGRRMPLGIPDAELEVGKHMLRPGDRMLLYTDGIIEARDEDGELFGTHRLAELTEERATAGLPVAETVRQLSEAVIEHQHGPPSDDATLLLADWSPSAARRMVVGGADT